MAPVPTDQDTYTTAEASRILRRTSRRVLQMLEAGELEGEKDAAGRWRIPQRAVHELLPSRPPRNGDRAAHQVPSGGSEPPPELLDRVFALEREIGRLEGRLELTEVAESTLRDSLERERERADLAEQRVRELEVRLTVATTPPAAPPETATEAPETVVAPPDRAQVPEPVEAPQKAERRSWWLRVFGG